MQKYILKPSEVRTWPVTSALAQTDSSLFLRYFLVLTDTVGVTRGSHMVERGPLKVHSGILPVMQYIPYMQFGKFWVV